jgi:hypothetical protein
VARFLPDSGALFQHVPRTGGTFVEKAIDLLGIGCSRWSKHVRKGFSKKHALLARYDFRALGNVKFTFAFVRHPVEYYVSTWRYMQAEKNRHPRGLPEKDYLTSLTDDYFSWHPFRSAARLYQDDFASWVCQMVEHEPGWCSRLFEWYVGPRGGEFVDFIGRTETLASDFTEVMAALGYHRQGFLGELVLRPRVNESQTPRPIVSDLIKQAILRSERTTLAQFWGTETKDRRWYGSTGLRPA